jgi:hypothetical protein
MNINGELSRYLYQMSVLSPYTLACLVLLGEQ